MTSRGAAIRRTAAFGAVAALCGLLTAALQAQFGGNQEPPYTPAKDAKDLRAVLFNWTWYMGMLRGIDEHELMVSLEYQATGGTIQVDGQPCTLTKYRASINYQTSGERVQYTCTRPNGQAYSNVEVVAWQYAWNEDIPGAEIVPGKGKATPMPAAVQERLIRLWASPQGAPKAAILGVNDESEWGANPATLLKDGVTTAGGTSVAWEGGKPVVTYPIPGVPGVTASATLDSKYMAERVVVKNGSTTTEFTYGDYKDWNNPLNRVDTLYAGKLTEKRNGTVVRDVTTKETETGSVYVVMPVPASVQKAITPSVPPLPERPFPPAPTFGPPAPQAAQNQPTPRRADGHPDLTGSWQSGGFFNWRYGFRRCGPTQTSDCSRTVNQTMDYEFEAPSRFGPNRPVYKPEHWDKVIALDMWTNKEDPVMTCQPLGLPRHGAPARIVQSDRDVVMIYRAGVDGGGGYGEYRVVPTDNRKRDPKRELETTFYGYTVGRWEGDTLVLDSASFVDTTWLARGGFFHSDQMHVVEKFTRKGNQILYEVTVEDPEVLVEPWVITPRVMTLMPNPDAGLIKERGNCEVYEQGVVTSQIRH
jgi:hypothetical protein